MHNVTNYFFNYPPLTLPGEELKSRNTFVPLRRYAFAPLHHFIYLCSFLKMLPIHYQHHEEI